MNASPTKKVRFATITISILLVLGTFALLAYMTQERTSSNDDDHSLTYFITDQCSFSNSTALKITATHQDSYTTVVCPWGFWDLIVGYAAVAVSLGFFGLLIILHWTRSLKMLKLTLLLGYMASVLLIATLIKLFITVITHQPFTFNIFPDPNAVQVSYSQLECNINTFLVLFSFLTVLVLTISESQSHKRNGNGTSNVTPSRRSLISTEIQ